jgi:hypothetical protein
VTPDILITRLVDRKLGTNVGAKEALCFSAPRAALCFAAPRASLCFACLRAAGQK